MKKFLIPTFILISALALFTSCKGNATVMVPVTNPDEVKLIPGTYQMSGKTEYISQECTQTETIELKLKLSGNEPDSKAKYSDTSIISSYVFNTKEYYDYKESQLKNSSTDESLIDYNPEALTITVDETPADANSETTYEYAIYGILEDYYDSHNPSAFSSHAIIKQSTDFSKIEISAQFYEHSTQINHTFVVSKIK